MRFIPLSESLLAMPTLLVLSLLCLNLLTMLIFDILQFESLYVANFSCVVTPNNLFTLKQLVESAVCFFNLFYFLIWILSFFYIVLFFNKYFLKLNLILFNYSISFFRIAELLKTLRLLVGYLPDLFNLLSLQLCILVASRIHLFIHIYGIFKG